MMREWPYTALSRDILGCTSPPTSRFPSALGLRPRDISRASGNLLVIGDAKTNTSLLSAVYGYNTSLLSALQQCMDTENTPLDLEKILCLRSLIFGSIIVGASFVCSCQAISIWNCQIKRGRDRTQLPPIAVTEAIFQTQLLQHKDTS